MQRRRWQYIDQQKRTQQANYSLDQLLNDIQINSVMDRESDLPFMLQLESEKLYNALMDLSEKERYVFLSFALEEKSYAELAKELNIGYKGVASIYHRTLKKMKDKLRRNLNEI